jgi:hypothetical protein
VAALDAFRLLVAPDGNYAAIGSPSGGRVLRIAPAIRRVDLAAGMIETLVRGR